MQTQSTRLAHSIQTFVGSAALAESGRCAESPPSTPALGGGRLGRLSPERLLRKRERAHVRVVVKRIVETSGLFLTTGKYCGFNRWTQHIG
jgi:hypothetical protein